jgi:CheY-like chemotaxis protein
MGDRKQRMLLVEDHHETRALLRRMLTLCGWDVVEAATTAEGLDRLEPPPDCLLLDLGLPDGDGEAILRKVRVERRPTRVIVNTGTDDPARLGAVAALHPEALLKKPLDAEGLRAICGAAADAEPIGFPIRSIGADGREAGFPSCGENRGF